MVRELIKLVVEDFEGGEDYSDYLDILERSSISRVMLDFVIEDAKTEGLITQGGDRDLYLTEKGKHYVIAHRLHSNKGNKG